MNWKNALLIVLVLFAATIPFAYGCLIQNISQKSQHVTEGVSMQICKALPVEPMEEIDTPGGPTIK